MVNTDGSPARSGKHASVNLCALRVSVLTKKIYRSWNPIFQESFLLLELSDFGIRISDLFPALFSLFVLRRPEVLQADLGRTPKSETSNVKANTLRLRFHV